MNTRGTARARVALAVLTAMALLAATAAVVYATVLERQRRPTVPVESLLLDRPARAAGDPAWTPNGTRPTVGIQPVPGLIRNWTNEGRAPTLDEAVFRYDTVREAEHAFWFDNPKWGVANKLRDPDAAGVPPGLTADRADGSCIGREPPGCDIWVYWARYGQYTVLFTYFDIDRGTPHETFTTHVRAVDRAVARQLRR